MAAENAKALAAATFVCDEVDHTVLALLLADAEGRLGGLTRGDDSAEELKPHDTRRWPKARLNESGASTR